MSVNVLSTPLRAEANELLRISDAIDAVAQRLEGLAATTLAPEVVQPPPSPGIGPTAGLLDETAWKTFFDYVRSRPPLGPELVPAEVAGCKRILGACAHYKLPASWAAYVLATAYHETAGRLYPIHEFGKGQGKRYGVPGARMDGKPGKNLRQAPFGRGDVQLTWEDNYERADIELGLGGALLRDFDLILKDPALSARILVRGMKEGWFTGKKLNDRIGPPPAPIEQFRKARVIVNSMDKADLIASYAVQFQEALLAAGWV